MAGDDAIDGDLFGDDSVGARPFIFAKSPPFCQNIYFSILDPPLSGNCVRLFAIDL